MSSLVDESIIYDFVIESRDHLAAIEPDLLQMEQNLSNPNKEVINRVFRAIHSIKGGAGFFAFEALKRLSHAMESVLMQVRDGKLKLSAPIMDVVFASLDRLKAMLDDIDQSDSIPIQQEIRALEETLRGQGIASGEILKGRVEADGLREFDLDAESVKSALRRGMNLFSATAYLHRDIEEKGQTPLHFLNNIFTVGVLLDAFLDMEAVASLEECLQQDLAVTLLFATVLEQDLASLALKLPEHQVRLMDMTDLKERAGISNRSPIDQRAPEDTRSDPVQTPLVMEEEAAQTPEKGASKGSRDAGAETLRVRVDLLTNLMNLAGELVLGRNQLVRAVAPHQRQIAGLGSILQNVNQVTTEMQEGIMQTRMQPIGTVFSRFPRIVRDLSRQLGKEIDVHIEGAEVELDKSIVEMLIDPLTHIIRNCVDHALETPDERRRNKKDASGTIHLHAFHEGGQVNIAIHDDGRGIDAKKVLEKAIARGLVNKADAAEMSEREMVNLIFAPGFSTADQVSEISGRGVGMDVVRTNVEKLGGHVEVDTEVGCGTTVRLRLPLTLAIIPSMIVGVSNQRFAIPQVNVVEFVWVKAADAAQRIEQVQGAEVLRLREKLLPLVRLADVLGLPRMYTDSVTTQKREDRRDSLLDRRDPAARPSSSRQEDRRQEWRTDYNIIVLRVGKNQYGVAVDELFDIEEIVVKPLSNYIQNTKCFSGATILGDGRVIMILDAGGLAVSANLHFSDLQVEEMRRAEEAKHTAELKASRRRSIILCEAGSGERFAIPQDRVLRLERVPVGRIEHIGEREYLEYRGEGIPLLRLDRYLEVRPLDPSLKELVLIIPKLSVEDGRQHPPVGILISSILDALDVEVELKTVEFDGPGLLGSAMVQDHLTLFLDPVPLVQASAAASQPIVREGNPA